MVHPPTPETARKLIKKLARKLARKLVGKLVRRADMLGLTSAVDGRMGF